MYNNQVRIIGGQFRGRKLRFPDIQGLRPTSDRMKETLFNWLSPDIVGADCLDLFAGSGAMGFEALSRGAQSVIFVDQHLKVIEYLQNTQKLLNAENMEIIHANTIDYLNKLNKKFDIVFVDPPFGANLATPCCQLLIERQLLNPNAYVYIEVEAGITLQLPTELSLAKEKQTKQVKYLLHRFYET